MSSDAARLVLGCTISFVLGGAAGVYGLRTLYGDIDPVDPARERTPECPSPPPCPACPPPVDCGLQGRLPPADAPFETFEDESDTDSSDDPSWEEDASMAGLPASAVPLAHAAVKSEIETCFELLEDPAPSGIALLQLTVTATGGVGFVTEALVTRATGGAAELAGCLGEAARRARFVWKGPDGRLNFKLPLSVGGLD